METNVSFLWFPVKRPTAAETVAHVLPCRCSKQTALPGKAETTFRVSQVSKLLSTSNATPLHSPTYFLLLFQLASLLLFRFPNTQEHKIVSTAFTKPLNIEIVT